MHLSVTYILIGINILVFAAETMAGGTENRETALKFGAMYGPYIKKGQWYRMFSSMFLHFGFIHLICNMYSLYNLGPALERFFGVPLFLVLYFVCGLAGNLLSYAVERRSGQNRISAGASGAIFGLLGSYLVFAVMPERRISSLRILTRFVWRSPKKWGQPSQSMALKVKLYRTQ